MSEKMKDVKQLNYNALMVLQCLFENSDVYRHIGLKEIEELIKNKYGYGPTHNTINKILHYLPDYGFDVRKGTRANPGFYLNSRFFSNGEVLFIIESIRKTKAMTSKDKDNLISKFKLYLGPEFIDIDNQQNIDSKGMEPEIINKIEIINEAIKKEKILQFAIRESGKKVKSSPYRIFERRGGIFLLYGLERDSEVYLLQVDLNEISNLKVNDKQNRTPIFKARNNQLVDERLLANYDKTHVTERYNHHLLIELPNDKQIIKNMNFFVPGVPVSTASCRKTLEKHFGKNNTIHIDDYGTEYLLVRDIYGNGETFMLDNYQLGKIVWPKAQEKIMKIRIAKLYNLYNQDKEPVEDDISISIAETEGEHTGNEEDWFSILKAESLDESPSIEKSLAKSIENKGKKEFLKNREFIPYNYIMSLFKKTKSRTSYVFEDYYYNDTKDGLIQKTAKWTVKLNWDEKNIKATIKEFENITALIKATAQATLNGDLDNIDIDEVSKYVASFKSSHFEQEAFDRVGGRVKKVAKFFIDHCRRYLLLVSSNSPNIIIKNEMMLMANSFIINKHADEFRETIERL